MVDVAGCAVKDPVAGKQRLTGGHQRTGVVLGLLGTGRLATKGS